MSFWIILLLLVVGLLGYVRLAPSNLDRWHRAAEGTEPVERQGKGSYLWREPVTVEGRERMAEIDRIARADPSTEVLAGSVAEGQITYISRSKWMGFPDYITVTLKEADPKVIEIYSRLRFGGSDMGVNAARVKRWLAAAR